MTQVIMAPPSPTQNTANPVLPKKKKKKKKKQTQKTKVNLPPTLRAPFGVVKQYLEFAFPMPFPSLKTNTDRKPRDVWSSSDNPAQWTLQN